MRGPNQTEARRTGRRAEHRRTVRRDEIRGRASRGRRPMRRPAGDPAPLFSTRALVILLAAVGAAVFSVVRPGTAIPIGTAVGVVTLLAQIVRD
ncbi:hypothetical protein [Actinomadura rayongensis]|uniref:Uncharacterized protein n=1 Tax=Actinomadura rayongensis TaxID=1429076 RepID=A0A6I4W600_9ACTN|nr:hypothetical protein [Actinomadura rayongensis]MXQ63626.1 hypothetical protein [Actinomadura rayongensis]